MDYEPRHAVEEFTLPPELAFMSDEAMNAFRDTQDEQLFEAERDAVQSAEPFQGAEAREAASTHVKEQNDANCEAYIAEHASFKREDNPELFEKLKQLAIKYSVHNMGSEAWHVGEADKDGNYSKVETSGRNQLQTELATLLGYNPDQPGPGERYVRSPEVVELDNKLEAARNKLAELSVARRRKIHKIGRKAQEKEFNDTADAYHEASIAAAVGYINDYRAKGKDPESLQAVAMHMVITEHGAFTAAEKHFMNEDTSHRGRLASWLGAKNRRLFAASVVGGAAAGFGIRTGARALFGTASGIAGGVVTGVAVGAGVGVAKSLASTRAHLFSQLDNRAGQDKKTLSDQLIENGNEDNAEATYSTFYGKLKEIIQTREQKDQSLNRRRVGGAALFGALGGAGGALLVDAAVDNHWFGIGGHGGSGSHGNTNGGNGNSAPGHGSSTGVGPDGNGTTGMGNHTAGYTDGFKDHVYVEHGHGYANELQDLAKQKGYHLSGHQAYADYQQMADKFHGHLFTNDHSYVRSAGDYGISRPGYANWNPAAVHYFNHLFEEQIKAGTVTKS